MSPRSLLVLRSGETGIAPIPQHSKCGDGPRQEVRRASSNKKNAPQKEPEPPPMLSHTADRHRGDMFEPSTNLNPHFPLTPRRRSARHPAAPRVRMRVRGPLIIGQTSPPNGDGAMTVPAFGEPRPAPSGCRRRGPFAPRPRPPNPTFQASHSMPRRFCRTRPAERALRRCCAELRSLSRQPRNTNAPEQVGAASLPAEPDATAPAIAARPPGTSQP